MKDEEEGSYIYFKHLVEQHPVRKQAENTQKHPNIANFNTRTGDILQVSCNNSNIIQE